MKNRVWKKIYECDCHCCLVAMSEIFNDSDKHEVLEFATFKNGGYPFSFIQRLKLIWKVLTTGECWIDDVCLGKEEALRFANDILKLFKEK